MRHLPLLAAALAALVAAAPRLAPAQTRDVATVDAAGARVVVDSAVAEARRSGWSVSVAVVDPGGTLVAFHRLDGAPASSVQLSLGKARTSALFGRPSKAIEDIIAGGRTAFAAVEGITPIEGAVPLVVGGRTVGAVGVSGVTSVQDAQVARAGAEALARMPARR